MNYYQFHIGDFRAGTIHMSRLARWIYRDMMDVYYDTERPLPLKLDDLCDLIGVESNDERRIVERVLRLKFRSHDDGFHHDKCDEVIGEFRAKADVARANGARGGRPPKKQENPEKPSRLFLGSETKPNGNPAETGSKANQEPITNNHKEQTSLQEVGNGMPVPQQEQRENCPHEQIIEAYHRLLPTGRVVRVWNDARRAKLRARWRESQARQSVEWWEQLFTYIAKSPFLTGAVQSHDRTPFQIDLEWIVNPSNFVKIIEGKYHSDRTEKAA